ncbi:MAG: hypothetical protein A2V67_01635 [Deltaproteobacteria bacterium RBG_13_61_14]|nr:MAG: hypothetical protein A2V67_01635 [Deltaproteobacteria bacterium RBG_13_61_14]
MSSSTKIFSFHFFYFLDGFRAKHFIKFLKTIFQICGYVNPIWRIRILGWMTFAFSLIITILILILFLIIRLD